MNLLDFFLLPENLCPFCKEEEKEDIICYFCEKSLKKINIVYEFDKDKFCYLIYFYNRFIQNIIHSFKFEDRPEYAEPIGKLMAKELRRNEFKEIKYIQSVPMDRKAIRKRGYNHIELIRDVIIRENNLIGVDVLEKTGHTIQQNKLRHIREREENVKDIFSYKKVSLLKGKKIFLLDDILTTGSTMKYALKALEEGEAEKIVPICFSSTHSDGISFA